MRKSGLLFLSLLLICLIACKKYPQGGWSHNAKKHLYGSLFSGYGKTWRLVLYEVNGIDSTSYISPGNSSTSFGNRDIIFNNNYGDDDKMTGVTPVFSYDISLGKKVSTFSFAPQSRSNTSQCKSVGKCEREIFRPKRISIEWKVLKLTDEELIISATDENLYRIILQKV